MAAGVETERADAAFKAACEALRAARRAARAEHGLVPEALLLNTEEKALFRYWYFGMPGDPPFPWYRHVDTKPGTWQNPDLAWSDRGLRKAIERVAARFGHAGRTPSRLKRWRSLLPIADAHAAKREASLQRHRVRELESEEREAEAAWRASREHIRTMVAQTHEGLAVHVRLFAGMTADNVLPGYMPLLLSAAKVSGTPLNLRDMEG